jgi:hypothetical protein
MSHPLASTSCTGAKNQNCSVALVSSRAGAPWLHNAHEVPTIEEAFVPVWHRAVCLEDLSVCWLVVGAASCGFLCQDLQAEDV